MTGALLVRLMATLAEVTTVADFEINASNANPNGYAGEVLDVVFHTKDKTTGEEFAMQVSIRLDEGPEASAFLLYDAAEKVRRHHLGPRP